MDRPREYYNLQRPNKSKSLPNVFNREEIEKLLQAPKNMKHKAILLLIYSAGLRLSEATNLRIKDIHADEGYLFIKDSKGKRDRKTVLSPMVLEYLRTYNTSYKPSYWLFEGQSGGKYSDRSLQAVFQKAKIKSRASPNVSFHSLRHSYATHLHERGTDIKLIQELLGHNDIKTTLRYTHVSKRTLEGIISPFDDLKI